MISEFERRDISSGSCMRTAPGGGIGHPSEARTGGSLGDGRNREDSAGNEFIKPRIFWTRKVDSDCLDALVGSCSGLGTSSLPVGLAMAVERVSRISVNSGEVLCRFGRDSGAGPFVIEVVRDEDADL